MPHWVWEIIFSTDIVVRLCLAVRIIMRRRPVGVSLAWLTIVFVFPLAGAVVYLTFGELRLGRRRATWAAQVRQPVERWLQGLRTRKAVDWSAQGPECEPLARLTEATFGVPALPGNVLQLIPKTDDVFRTLIADIDAAQRTCQMVFYIWHLGGLADEVAEALIRAAGRGVTCRVLVDAVGSRDFLRGPLASHMRAGGVQLVSALPGGLLRAAFVRFDLRMHRKIAVIDGEVAYTGSLNLVDPRFFKQDAGVGQWVDAMVRVRGPAVEGLLGTFLGDWVLEAGEGLDCLSATGDFHPLVECGPSVVQVVPSGPLDSSDAILRSLLMAIYSARRELILTTPYFVPDEPLVAALMSAAQRGVDVTLIVPGQVDSRLVRLASQAFKGDLLAAGVRVAMFHGGLLHTKSITVDGEFSLFGSLNLDPRSLHLNFEITLVVYDRGFTADLRQLQQSYLADCQLMNLEQWRSRSGLQRLAENTARLAGPLL
jgi:cardiolipin synthase A/B